MEKDEHENIIQGQENDAQQQAETDAEGQAMEEMKEPKVELNKHNLETYQILKTEMETVQKKLREDKQALDDQFNQEHETQLDAIRTLSKELEVYKDQLKIGATEVFKETGEKKLLGGLGIRVMQDLVYDDKAALGWAKEHQLCLSLDKSAFKKIAKSQDLDFVEKKESVTVTFPKEIKFDDEAEKC